MPNKVCLLNDSLVENFLYIYFCLNFKMNNESAARFLALKFRNVFLLLFFLTYIEVNFISVFPSCVCVCVLLNVCMSTAAITRTTTTAAYKSGVFFPLFFLDRFLLSFFYSMNQLSEPKF